MLPSLRPAVSRSPWASHMTTYVRTASSVSPFTRNSFRPIFVSDDFSPANCFSHAVSTSLGMDTCERGFGASTDFVRFPPRRCDWTGANYLPRETYHMVGHTFPSSMIRCLALTFRGTISASVLWYAATCHVWHMRLISIRIDHCFRWFH